MMSFNGIRKQFGSVCALHDVTLSLRPGAVTALVGPNGSGKTTLIKIALGLTRADQGDVRFDGTAVDEAGTYRSRVGYMPQIARFPEHLTGRDVIELVSELRAGVRRDESLIATLDLERSLDKRIGTMSGGTRQKLNAAIAFLFAPSLLVLDEPTSGLDPISSGALKDAVRAARDNGRTVLVTSHVLSELEETADDVAFLCDGRLRFAGAVAALLARTGAPTLERAIAQLMREQAA
jgi:Cu-processing system ATP-binding protein